MLGLIWTVIIGFVVGIVAKLIMPGKEKLGFIATTVLGRDLHRASCGLV